MAQKLTVVESNTSTVNKLSARVGLLITIMSFGTVLMSSTCIYMFTGLNDFKQMYNSHRLSTQQQLYSLQKENMEVLVKEIRTLERTLDNKLHMLSNRITKLESVVQEQQEDS